MTERCSKPVNELPLMSPSFPFEMPNAFKHKAQRYGSGGYPGGGTNVEEQTGLYRDLSAMPPAVTQRDLDKAIADVGMKPWEPKKWKYLKTLAAAAAGNGTVDLMTSREQWGKTIAVKNLPRDLLRSSPEEFRKQYPQAKERPWIDIAVVKHLNNLRFPCAADLLGLFVGREQAHIMTSFANRGDLFGWCQLDTSKAGPAREAVMRPIVSQMFMGVCWLHNLGIAHRDLSVENVLLTDNGEKGPQVKIIDFGMASLCRTAKQEVRGKRSYQAPEMHLPTDYDTFLADNFAVGVIVYCMGVHYYPWEQTKPGKDRSFEFARVNGLSTFLQKKRMPCDKRPIADVFTKYFLDIVCGLLDFTPETRFSLGETCFESSSMTSSAVAAKAMPRQTSDASTTDSETKEVEVSNLDCELDDETGQRGQSRTSTWDCRWLFLQDVAMSNP
mmetsp:Transcript_8692/g.15893  ORF Transcript_8692/g.15893 Transcript_8692/m.15893 type:complete len:442 (-) Transcript_8692:280-1605(-)